MTDTRKYTHREMPDGSFATRVGHVRFRGCSIDCRIGAELANEADRIARLECADSIAALRGRVAGLEDEIGCRGNSPPVSMAPTRERPAWFEDDSGDALLVGPSGDGIAIEQMHNDTPELDRANVERLRDTLTAWLETTK